MVREYVLEVKLQPRDSVHHDFDPTLVSYNLSLPEDKGFTEEQLSLLIQEQIQLTLSSVSSISKFAADDELEFVP